MTEMSKSGARSFQSASRNSEANLLSLQVCDPLDPGFAVRDDARTTLGKAGDRIERDTIGGIARKFPRASTFRIPPEDRPLPDGGDL
jgi:hypothetical protein